MLKVDLHLHTGDDPVDHISYSTSQLVDRAAALGFGALALTLHDRQFEDRRLADYARERGIVLIRGIERTVRGRHVLLINFDADAAESVRTLDDVARLKARGNGLVIAPQDAAAICAAIRAGRVQVCTTPAPALELAAVVLGMQFRSLGRAKSSRYGVNQVRAARI